MKTATKKKNAKIDGTELKRSRKQQKHKQKQSWMKQREIRKIRRLQDPKHELKQNTLKNDVNDTMKRTQKEKKRTHSTKKMKPQSQNNKTK